MQGMPRKQMVRYCAVPATASAGVDMTDTMGYTNRSSTSVKTTDRARKMVAVLPTASAARWRFSPPTAWAMVTVEPMANPTSMTVIMCMTWLPTETAVVLATPSNWPMMNRSAMPYSVCRK